MVLQISDYYVSILYYFVNSCYAYAELLGNFNEFNYVVNISKSDSVVATSDSKHVKVKPVEKGTTAIYTAKIFLGIEEVLLRSILDQVLPL